jgi:UDP-glucose 4-epimerase
MQDSEGYEGERVLVTGATGFIGSHLCRRLLTRHAEIHAVSRLRHHASGAGIQWWQGDLAEAEWVDELVKEVKPSLVFHLAGEVTGARKAECVMPTFRGNLMSTLNLIAAANVAGCRRFVLAGSLEEPERGVPDAVPCSPYAAAKWASSAYARMFHALYQFPVVVARIFMVYGPGQRDLQKLIPYVITSVLRETPPKLSSGSRLVDWIYVEDVVEGLLKAGKVKGIEGLTIDLGSGNLVPIRKMVEILVTMMNSNVAPLFGALPDRPMEPIKIADVERSRTLMSWTARASLEDGLQRTVEWYREHFSELQLGASACVNAPAVRVSS